jgi:hypothetical protein
VDLSADAEWAHALIASGKARWSGGKPAGAAHPAPTVAGRSVSEAVLEDRR